MTTANPIPIDARLHALSALPDSTEFGMIAFLVQHDSYHIGQLALLQNDYGLPAMAYG